MAKVCPDTLFVAMVCGLAGGLPGCVDGGGTPAGGEAGVAWLGALAPASGAPAPGAPTTEVVTMAMNAKINICVFM